MEERKALSDLRALSQKGARGSLLYLELKLVSVEDEPREKSVVLGADLLFVCVLFGRENGRKEAKFKDSTIDFFVTYIKVHALLKTAVLLRDNGFYNLTLPRL